MVEGRQGGGGEPPRLYPRENRAVGSPEARAADAGLRTRFTEAAGSARAPVQPGSCCPHRLLPDASGTKQTRGTPLPSANWVVNTPNDPDDSTFKVTHCYAIKEENLAIFPPRGCINYFIMESRAL